MSPCLDSGVAVMLGSLAHCCRSLGESSHISKQRNVSFSFSY